MAEYQSYYFDDPEEDVAPRQKSPAILASILLLLVGGIFLKTTLAANITINSSGRVEFGQAMSVTAACSGSSVITMTPASSFTNSSGGGSFYFSSVSVSGIPSSCNGVDFLISAFDSSTSSTALPIFNSTASIASIWDNAGSFQGGHGFIGSTITSGAGSFTVSFTNPIALSSAVAKLTLQSVTHASGNCSTENICSVGDIGPGGGVVFYVGATFAETGATCGANCHYLESAPIGWANGKPSSLNGACGGA